ncbi:MAG TPA: methyltransferase domain-containing protein [Vicinamibacterales bacterium]|nr:methyltransferase domain-containing protein [Vicinamibacterales bacterium]
MKRLAPLTVVLTLLCSAAWAQVPFEPEIGQPGKDVVWVPTTPELVEKMLDMAAVTAQDVVMDLGSGDGRNVIAAARRGARAVGFEYNPEMVALSRKLAEQAGVASRATFVQGDMYEADISGATVMALFLLPTNLEKLRDRFFSLKPGTRLVMNTFAIPDWDPDVSEKIEGSCTSWCTSLLYYVPAQVAGRWKLPQGELMLDQQYQVVSGLLTIGGTEVPLTGAKLRGDQITFTVGETEYAGRVAGDRIEGQGWTATRVR